MIKRILKSVREYKKATFLTPFYVSLEVILEVLIPVLMADIIDKGIVITGGGALIDGIDELLAHELKVPVFIAESPLTCVAEGTGVLLDNVNLMEK